jgi:hypothetical protein
MLTETLNRGVRPIGGRTLVFLCVLVALGSWSLARDSKSGRAVGIGGIELSLEQTHLVLEGVSPRELTGLGAGLAIDLGRWKIERRGSIRQLLPEVIRSVPALWRAKAPDGKGVSGFQVGLQVLGDNGHAGCLSHLSRPGSEIRLRVQALPTIVAKSEAGWAFLEGGALFFLNLEEAREAGEYSGTLMVTVTQP